MKKRIYPKAWLAKFGIRNPSGRDVERYCNRAKSLKHNEQGYRTVLETEPDPRRTNNLSPGRPKGKKNGNP